MVDNSAFKDPVFRDFFSFIKEIDRKKLEAKLPTLPPLDNCPEVIKKHFEATLKPNDEIAYMCDILGTRFYLTPQDDTGTMWQIECPTDNHTISNIKTPEYWESAIRMMVGIAKRYYVSPCGSSHSETSGQRGILAANS